MARLLSINTTDPKIVQGLQFHLTVVSSLARDMENEFSDSDEAVGKKFQEEFARNASNPQRSMLDLNGLDIALFLDDEEDVSEADFERELHMTITCDRESRSFRIITVDKDGKPFHDMCLGYDEVIQEIEDEPNPLLQEIGLDSLPILSLLEDKGILINADPEEKFREIDRWLFAAMFIPIAEDCLPEGTKILEEPVSAFRPN